MNTRVRRIGTVLAGCALLVAIGGAPAQAAKPAEQSAPSPKQTLCHQPGWEGWRYHTTESLVAVHAEPDVNSPITRYVGGNLCTNLSTNGWEQLRDNGDWVESRFLAPGWV